MCTIAGATCAAIDRCVAVGAAASAGVGGRSGTDAAGAAAAVMLEPADVPVAGTRSDGREAAGGADPPSSGVVAEGVPGAAAPASRTVGARDAVTRGPASRAVVGRGVDGAGSLSRGRTLPARGVSDAAIAASGSVAPTPRAAGTVAASAAEPTAGAASTRGAPDGLVAVSDATATDVVARGGGSDVAAAADASPAAPRAAVSPAGVVDTTSCASAPVPVAITGGSGTTGIAPGAEAMASVPSDDGGRSSTPSSVGAATRSVAVRSAPASGPAVVDAGSVGAAPSA
ncbi:hypothetical protein CH252_33130 [Rhodococcus sp. 06-1477-1B]|nr:hypothetical protein CH252_33130 [Rhodococcus sp. 06-1477-1B]